MEKEHEHSSSHGSHGPKKPESMLSSMPPKFAFWAGFVTAVAIISVVGFAIMLTLTFKGGDTDNDVAKTATDTNTTVKTNTNSGTAAAAAVGTLNTDLLTNVKGEGEITLVEFSDPECPYCQRFHSTLKDVLDGDYSSKVKWGYMHFPLEGLHPTSPKESEAAQCAADQGKFWEYLNELFTVTEASPALEVTDMKDIASTVGLNASDFADCLDNGTNEGVVANSVKEAQKLGGTGTPFSVLIDENGKVLTTIKGAQPAESLTAMLDNYL